MNFVTLSANDYIYSENEQKTNTLCNFRFVLEDKLGSGWYPEVGIGITVDGADYGFLNLPWGTTYAEEIIPLSSGEVLFSWIGFFPIRYYFEIYNSLDELIYTSPEDMYEGVFLTYQNECVECIPITDLEGVYISEEDQVNLTWIAPESTDLIGFDIYRNDVIIEHLPPTTISYSDNTEELENGAYKYCVIPVYPFVCSLEDQCFEISITDCFPITDFKGEYIVEEHNVNLSWNAPESVDLTGFDVFRNDVVIVHLPPTTTFYTDNTEKFENGDYKYCVVPVYPFECTFEEKCFETYIGLGIKNYSALLHLYPNPAHKEVNITGEDIATVKVFNNIGQLIHTYHNISIVNVSSYKPGIYLFHITTTEGKVGMYKVAVVE
jgi:hypothetical protein